MRICFIGDGNSIHIMRMADWLRAHKCIVQLVHVSSVALESPVHYDHVLSLVEKPGLRGFLGRIPYVRAYVYAFQPDIVHGHYLTSGGFYAAMSGHPNVVVSAWGSDIYRDTKKPSRNLLVRYALKKCNAITGGCDDIIRVIKSYHPKAHIHKFIVGPDTAIFIPKPELKGKIFTFLSGRASRPIYNPIRIVRAFEFFNGNDWRLLLQRPTKPYPELEEIVQNSKQPWRPANIEWYSVRDHSEMPDLFGQANVTISVPDTDGGSALMLESMACGVPVIASRIPQNDEWNGLGVYKPKDDSVKALAEVMDRVCKNPEETRKYGDFARSIIIQKGEWDVQMYGMLRLYEAVRDGHYPRNRHLHSNMIPPAIDCDRWLWGVKEWKRQR